MNQSKGSLALPSRLYDVFKWFALILLPAVGAAYFSLAGLWNLPNAEQVVGTIVVAEVFLGAILQISKMSYDKSDKSKDGAVIVDGDGLKRFEINATADDVASKRVITLAVKEEPDLPLSS